MSSKKDFLIAIKDRKYWDRRQKQLVKNLEKSEAKLIKKLNKLYVQEAKRLSNLIASYYAKYGDGNVIEYRNLLKTLPAEEIDLLMKDVDAFELKHPEYSHLVSTRKSIYKLDRMEGLRLSLQIQQFAIADIEMQLLTKHLLMVFNKSYLDSMSMLGHGTKVNIFNNNVAKKFINKKWTDGKNYSDRIYNNREKVAKYLTENFRNATIRGDAYKQTAKALTEKFTEVSSRNAQRLIYTEGTYVMNEGAITPFEDYFEEYEYSAILDNRTSPICRALDGRRFLMKDRQAGVNFPPMHPWCRSTFSLVIESMRSEDDI